MPFTSLLVSVQSPGEPATVLEINVEYRDTDYLDWHVSKTIRITIGVGLTPAEQWTAIRNQIISDAQSYLVQLAVYAGLKSKEGDSIVIVAP